MLAASERFSTPSSRSQWADALLGERHRLGLLVHDEVALGLLLDLGELALHDGGGTREPGDHPRHPLVERRLALRALVAPGDDQRRPRLVDQDRVDLVDDRVVVLALDHVLEANRMLSRR